MFRLIVAFLVSPTLACAVARVFAASDLADVQWRSLPIEAARAASPIYMFALPVGVIALAFAWFIGRIGILSAASAGAAIALLFSAESVVAVLADDKFDSWYKSTVMLQFGGDVLLGASIGALIWWLGIWRNPMLGLRRTRPVASEGGLTRRSSGPLRGR